MTVPPNNPLGYLNNLQALIPWVTHPFAPTTANNDFTIPTMWIETATATVFWVLVAKPNGVAVWIPSSGSSFGPIDTLTPNSGTSPIVPDVAGNVDLLGAGSITTVGSLNTLTVELTGLTNHAVLVGAGTTTITKIGPTATAGQVLQSAGSSADPAFSTATYPATATATGTILRADGTNWVATTATYPATTTINQILYSSSNNVIAGLPTANNGVLVTSGSGVPSIGNILGAGFTYTTSVAGNTTPVYIFNTDNTNVASHSFLEINVGGTSGGDPYTTFSVGSARAYGVGIDNQSSGQPFSISTGAAENVRPGGGTKLLNLSSAGQLNLPLQSSFSAQSSTSQTDVTGDGTQVTLVCGAEYYDQNSEYDTTTGIFTAKETGIFQFNVSVAMGDLAAGHTGGIITLRVGTAPTSVTLWQGNPGANRDASNIFVISGSIQLPVTATDTAKVLVTVSGSTKVVDLLGAASNTPPFCSFSASMIA